MRAVLVQEFGPTDTVEIGEIESPLKLGTEVLVDVHAAGMNPIDYKTVIGKGAAKAVEPLLPWIPGGDVAGVIAEGPYEAHDLQPGDAVYGAVNHWRTRGSYAEQAVVPSLALAPKPESLSFEEAAAVPCAALTAWDAVVRVAKARAGQRLLGEGRVGRLEPRHHRPPHRRRRRARRGAEGLPARPGARRVRRAAARPRAGQARAEGALSRRPDARQ